MKPPPIRRSVHTPRSDHLAKLTRSLEQEIERSSFLSEIGALLVTADDSWEIARGLASRSAPAFRSLAIVDLIDERGRVHRAAASAFDPAHKSIAEALTTGVAWIPEALRSAIDSGRSRITAHAPDLVEGDAKLQPVSLLAVPLTARGKPIGAITFVSDQRTFNDDDVTLARDLAARAAPALESARLYRERSQIARTLHESLVPTQLPSVPGLEIGARYRAAGEAFEAGGDFYDIIRHGSDWALVVGDVCGKGARAAALTGLARYTLRAAAVKARRSKDVLLSLNEALWRENLGERYCTLAYVTMQPKAQDVRLRVTIAGHPPPLVLRTGGRVEMVGAPGTALGIIESPRLHETTSVLHPGDAIVVYTDGYTESRGEYGVLGEEGLIAMLQECIGFSAEDIAASLEARTLDFQRYAGLDDMAVLVVRVPR